MFAHELGHNLGLAHAGRALVAGEATSDPDSASKMEYGDLSGAMGFCCTSRGYNAPHLIELGWATPMALVNSDSLPSQNASVTVQMSSMSSTHPGDGIVQVVVDWKQELEQYWIQFKTADAYDQWADPSWVDVVQIKKWSGNAYEKTVHVHTFLQGHPWIDDDGGLRIDANISAPNVNVVFTRLDTPSAPPTTDPTVTQTDAPTPSPCKGKGCPKKSNGGVQS